ncbi:unnamed protein product [Soboliphyme baturini]|uniref:Renin receptor n=1 Tax=Soboliphyme baturini TaxID=241478 RepID=A0A183IFI0_9BILA|nr:unnamed protein product [Soboliphyme baturini]
MYSSSVPAIDGTLLGLSADSPVEWLNAGQLFNRPEALIVYAITSDDFTANVHLPSKKFFVLQEDRAMDFGSVFSDIQRAFVHDRYYVAEVSADGTDGNLDGSRRHVDEGVTYNESQRLQLELKQLRQVTGNALALGDLHNGVPDFFLFHIDGIQQIQDRSKDVMLDSTSLLAPMEQVSKEILKSADAFKTAYGGNCIVQVLITSGIHVRKPRASKNDRPASASNTTVYTTYQFYSPDYPVMFNIILWLTISLSVTVLMISVVMWSIDPGRDSIIYRMTMTRAKKD